MTSAQDRVIVKAVQTCAGSPAQWDAWTLDGQYRYLRYRFGVGTVGTVVGATDPERTVARFRTGDPWGGHISLPDFCGRAGLVLALDHAPAPVPDPEQLRRSLLDSGCGWITARYPGMCEFCGRRFEPGEAVRIEVPRGWRGACCAAGTP